MKISSSKIPLNANISKYLPVNYQDTFLCTTNGLKDVSADDIMIAFWTARPTWLNILFKIRDLLVKPFGLKTGEGGNTEQLEQAIRNGTDYRFMSVAEKSTNETILSLNDKHLKAFFAIYIEENKNIYLTTLVNFHNKLGFTYFYIICPFHIIVVKNMFRQVIKDFLSHK